MFKFSELKQIHLEITNNCQASCPMCNRNVQGGLDNPLIKNQEWTLEEFIKIMDPVLAQLDGFYFCGNFGDPILNSNLLAMCRYSKAKAPNTKIGIHTNGGAKSTEWWIDLAGGLPKDHLVTFAIDGLEDTHHLYRIGTTFENVTRNAKAFIRAGGNAEWVFIRFKHNEHQVEEARKLADKWGFKKFTVKNSNRFILEPRIRVLDKLGNHTHDIEPATDTPIKFIDKKILDSYKDIVKESVITCKVQQDKEVYIDAYKNLYPCCWLGSVPFNYIKEDGSHQARFEMLEQHKEMISRLGTINTLEKSIQEIIDSTEYQTCWDEYWTTNKLITCAKTCGVTNSVKFSKPTEQIVYEPAH